tara:strand:- start:1231 stop:1422 length:192 start_codon:yes stop_codon:yes gene_type:complete
MNQKTHIAISISALDTMKKMVDKLDADNKMLLQEMRKISLFDKYEPAGPAVLIALDAIAKATQ